MVQFVSKPIPGVDPHSEVTVAKAFEQLDDDWYVIHSVAWQGIRGKRERDGEADFVLIAKNVGVIVVEVKGGSISIERGQWKSERADDGRIVDIENPFEQAAAGKSKLFKWLGERLPFSTPTMHAVIFPGSRAPRNMGPAASPKIVIDRPGTHEMASAIGRVVSHWKLPCRLTDKQAKQIIDLLAPTTTIRRTLADYTYDAEQALIKLTEEQRRAFAGLRRTRRAVIHGGPGSGKTLLASEKAAQLVANGSRTLLVCYNALLGQALRCSKHLHGVEVSTFHSLCLAAARKANVSIPQPIPQTWWELEAPYYLVEGLTEEADKFDAIIVDEGQDFAEDWLLALLATLRDQEASPFYVFTDVDQKLWPRKWEPRTDWLPYELTINCRNTHPIALRVAGVVDQTLEIQGARGPEPKWSALNPKTDTAAFVCDVIADLLEDGFEPKDIVVLCEDAALVDTISQMTAGTASCCRYGGNGVVIETIARFKGLDAVAIILVLSDLQQTPDTSAYIGFSRARSYLHVIGPNIRQRTSNWLKSEA